jgi:hypothetical protein
MPRLAPWARGAAERLFVTLSTGCIEQRGGPYDPIRRQHRIAAFASTKSWLRPAHLKIIRPSRPIAARLSET